MANEKEVKSGTYAHTSGSYSLSDSLRRVVINVSSSRETSSVASQAFEKQLSNYVREQG
jgi:hypothetical protein